MDTFPSNGTVLETAAEVLLLDQAIWTRRNEQYPLHLWGFLGAFIGLVACCQLAARVYARYSVQSPKSVDLEKNAGWIDTRISLRRVPIAIVNAFRTIAFRSTIVVGGGYELSLADVFMSAAYILLLLILGLVNTNNVSGRHDVLYFADRFGALATSQLPLITALGTKNNAISFLTGIGYDKLNYLHRMTARVCMMMMWIHAFARISIGVDWTEGWLLFGLAGALGWTILCIFSLRPVRQKSYEFFYYTHMSLVLLLLVGAWCHTSQWRFDKYVWPSLIVWGLDRLIRLGRIIFFNTAYFGLDMEKSLPLDATAEVVSANFLRLTVKRPPRFRWSPGQTAYLTFPSVSTLPFESHPFTIGSYDSSQDRLERLADIALLDAEDMQKNHLQEPKATVDEKDWKELVFLINVRGGLTKRLALAAEEKDVCFKVFVDGPYGPAPNLHRFDTNVLVAGGTGVSYTLPILLDVIEQTRLGKSHCTKVLFIWSIRDSSNISWIAATLASALALAPPTLKIDVRIYVTGVSSHQVTLDVEDDRSFISFDAGDETKKGSPGLIATLVGCPEVTVVGNRPGIYGLLREESELTRGGRMSVTVCASQPLARAVRNALKFPLTGASSVLRGGASVSLFVESFGYA